eukprot:CAMPEP_0204908964 /NCGR_PEP_ID=MMETSP1397-20131031/7802_1 /ASSEMBLY_ACC=CAM_ASM_000891 /TAXON_ID=49980 /ORGANISM="Climacostomum Climacostomum virens, Strain Stock W-24" /LENGTH=298 /DNA_ID=CAMNT_0052078671 /DNA_START=101 /DNA_END=994 /DNA_ORIENTATION=+
MQEHCVIKKAETFSHFVKVGETLLASSPQNNAIYHVSESPFSSSQIDLENWPGEPFKPSGITAFGSNKLFVINNAKPTVEIFDVVRSQTEVRLIYERTIELAGPFIGQLHSIIAISEDELYITDAIPDLSTPDDLLSTLLTTWRLVFTKSSSLLHCTKGTTKLLCAAAFPGSHLQGLYYDGVHIFVADTVSKSVIRLKRKKDGSIRERNRVDLSFSPIQLQSYHGIVYAVGHADYYEAFSYNPQNPTVVSGVIAEIKKEKRDWLSSEVIVEQQVSGACSVYRSGKTILVGHCHEPSVL